MPSQKLRTKQALELLSILADPQDPSVSVYNATLRNIIAYATEGKAPPTYVPATFKMVYKWTSAVGSPASNVFWGHDPIFTGLDTQLPLVTAAMQAALTSSGSILTCISPAWHCTSIEAFDNTGTTNNYNVLSTNIAGTYAGGGNPLPPNCAFVSSWDNNLKVKGGHPRTYWGGITDGMFGVAGAIDFTAVFIAAATAAAIAFLQALINQLSSRLSAAQVGNLSLFANKAPRPSAVFQPYSANTATVHNRMDSQRRRLGKEATTF